MNQRYQSIGEYGAAPVISAEERNRVLRNTYWLLALSMVPTVIGAFIGTQIGMLQIFGRMSIWMQLGIFFVGAYGLMFLVEKNKNSSVGVIFLMIFTFFMGLMLSRLLSFTMMRYANGTQLIAIAFAGTAGIFAAMATLATVIKRDISTWGKFLSVGLLMAIAVLIANFWLESGPLGIALLLLIMGISSAFLLYSVKSVIDGGETNYISATLSIYVSLYNVFSSLLQLLGIFGGEE